MAIVTNRPPGSAGGIQRFVQQLMRAAQEAGSKVDIIQLVEVVPERTVVGVQRYFESVLSHDFTGMPNPADIADAAALADRLRSCEFVVLAGSPPMYLRRFHTIMRALDSRIPPTVLAILFPMQEIEYYLGAEAALRFAQVLHPIAAACAAVVVPSEFSRRGIVLYFGAFPPVTTIAHGAASAAAVRAQAKKACAEVAVSYTNSGGHVAFVGRVEQLAMHKNVEAAVRVWPEVRQAVNDATLILVGGGDLPLPSQPGVVRAGHLEDASRDRIVGTAAASLLISAVEAFGLVATESLALGTPVIGLSGGAVSEFVTHRVNGLLLDAYPIDVQIGAHVATHFSPDHAELRDAIIELLVNHDLRGELSRGASTHVLSRTWRTVFNEYRASVLSM
jgi:glycosyltransferase involved in cell wall biosynthesis